jgi:hypothetical protein
LNNYRFNLNDTDNWLLSESALDKIIDFSNYMNKLFYDDLQFNSKSILNNEIIHFKKGFGTISKNKEFDSTINLQNYQKYINNGVFSKNYYLKNNNNYQNSFDLYNNISYRGNFSNINNFSKRIKFKNLNNIFDLGLNFTITNNIPNMVYPSNDFYLPGIRDKKLFNTNIENTNMKESPGLDFNMLSLHNLEYLKEDTTSNFSKYEKNENKNYIYIKKKVKENKKKYYNKENSISTTNDNINLPINSNWNLNFTKSEIETFDFNTYGENNNNYRVNSLNLPIYYQKTTNKNNFEKYDNNSINNKNISNFEAFEISGKTSSSKSGHFNKNIINVFDTLGTNLVREVYDNLDISEFKNYGNQNALSSIFLDFSHMNDNVLSSNNYLKKKNSNNLYQKINLNKIAGRINFLPKKYWNRYLLKLEKINLISYKYNESFDRKRYINMYNSPINNFIDNYDFEKYINIKNKYMAEFKNKAINRLSLQILKKTFINHLKYLMYKIDKLENILNLKLKHFFEIQNLSISYNLKSQYANEIQRKQEILKKLKKKYNWLDLKIKSELLSNKKLNRKINEITTMYSKKNYFKKKIHKILIDKIINLQIKLKISNKKKNYKNLKTEYDGFYINSFKYGLFLKNYKNDNIFNNNVYYYFKISQTKKTNKYNNENSFKNFIESPFIKYSYNLKNIKSNFLDFNSNFKFKIKKNISKIKKKNKEEIKIK